MVAIRAFLVALLLPSLAIAQVKQSGNVTNGHPVVWVAPGVIGDAGTSSAGALNTLGITSSGSQSDCINSGPVSSPYYQFCLGSNSNGTALMSLNAVANPTNAPAINIQVNGGTPVVINQAGLQFTSGMLGNIALTYSATGNVNSTPTLSNTWTFSNNGGVNTTVDTQTYNLTNITGASGQAIWASRDSIVFSGPSSITSGASYVPRVMDGIVTTPMGYGAGHPVMWGAISNVIDQTNQASATAGGLLTHEFDQEAAGLDNATPGAGRQAIVINFLTHNYPTNAASQFTSAIDIVSSDAGVSLKTPIVVAVPYSVAAIQLATATSVGGAPAIQLSSTQSIDFGNGYKVSGDIAPGFAAVSFFHSGLDFFQISTGSIKITDGTQYSQLGVTGSLTQSLTSSSGTFASYMVGATGVGNISADGASGLVLSSTATLTLLATGIKVGSTAAVSCTGVTAGTVAVVQGLVTHC